VTFTSLVSTPNTATRSHRAPMDERARVTADARVRGPTRVQVREEEEEALPPPTVRYNYANSDHVADVLHVQGFDEFSNGQQPEAPPSRPPTAQPPQVRLPRGREREGCVPRSRAIFWRLDSQLCHRCLRLAATGGTVPAHSRGPAHTQQGRSADPSIARKGSRFRHEYTH
jgi:hypothetical protein